MKQLTSRQIIGHIMAATDMLGPEFAKKHGFAKSTLYDVTKGELKTPYVRKIISETIGKSIEEIWPPSESGEGESISH